MPSRLAAQAALAGLAFAIASVAQTPAAISTNFRGNGGASVTGPAGVANAGAPTAFGGWNNANGGAGSNITLLDQGGVDRGTRLQYSSASTGYQLNPAAASQDGNLFDGQIITSVGGAPVAITVTGVPYAQYDVYVYFGHGPTHANRDVALALGAQTFAARNENLATYVDPVTFRQCTTTTVPGQVGNYVVFAQQTAPQFTLTLQPASSGTPGSSGVAGFQIVDRAADSDSDGLPDAWELQWFGNLAQNGYGDPDADLLANAGELARGTAPTDADSDDDLSSDGHEVARGTDPLDPDSDDDTLRDGVETDTGTFVSAANTGTDPLLRDTDGDGPHDGAEVKRGSDPCDAQSLPNLPNVVVVLADDLGWGELGSYGQQRILTPNLDQLAQNGMRFTQFYCGSPVCAPTRCTIQMGQHTGHCEIRNNLASAALDPGAFTIGRMLQDEGYVTALVGKWGLGDVGSTGVPNQQGYDHFFGFLDQTHAHWHYPNYLWRNATQVAYPTNNGVFGPTNAGTVHAHDEMTREALQWIDNNHQRPFFLHLTYTAPHVSLQEPPHSDPAQAALGRTAIDEFYATANWPEPNANFASPHYTSNARPRAAYAAMISAMDRDIGRLMQKLQQHGIADDTLVLFTSDNGTTYCCGVDFAFFNSLQGLRGYKGEVYEGGIRVPAIAHWPGRIAPGSVTPHVAAAWDVLPTVADLIDAETPDTLDGVSFLPTLFGQPFRQEQHAYLYWEYDQGGRRKAVRMGDWKGVRMGDVAAGAPLQLYNLATDRNETTDVAAQQPAIAAQIERIMASRHVFEGQFHRGLDEFPTISGVTLTNASPHLRLDAAATGHVRSPLAFDAGDAVSLPLRAQAQNIAGRLANVSLLLGDGALPTGAIRFELDAQQRAFRIRYGTTVLQAAMAANVDAWGWFDLACRYDPTTGHAVIEQGGQVLVQGALAGGPALVSHYGYLLDNAQALVRPLDAALAGRWLPTWTPFGAGCAGTAGTPTLRAAPSSLPFLSATFEAEVTGFPTPNGVGLGLLGVSDASWNGAPLPLPLAALGMPGCALHVSLDVVAALPATQGRANWQFAIPAVGALAGFRFYQQAATLDPAANAFGLVTSNAGVGVVGRR